MCFWLCIKAITSHCAQTSKGSLSKNNIHRTCHNKQITSVELDKLRSKLYNCKIDLWEFNVCDQDLEVQYKFGSHWNHVCDFPPLKMVFLIKRLVYIAIDKCNLSLAVLDEVRSNWNVRSLQLPLSCGYVLTFFPLNYHCNQLWCMHTNVEWQNYYNIYYV